MTNEEEGLEIEIIAVLNDPHGDEEKWESFIDKFKSKTGLDVESRVMTVQRLLSIFKGHCDNLISEAISLLLDMKQQELDETLAYKLLNDQVQEYKEAEEKIREILEEICASEPLEGTILKLRNVLSSANRRVDCEKIQFLMKSIDKLGNFPIFVEIKEKCGK